MFVAQSGLRGGASGRCLGAKASAIACIVALAFTAGRADAQDSGDWKMRFNPYLWGSGLSGSVATVPGVPPADIDKSFSEILDNLDLGAMAGLTARKDNFGLFGDVMYVKIGAEQALGPVLGRASLDAKNFAFTLGGDYVIARSQRGELRVAGGLRYWNVETDLRFSGGTVGERSGSASNDWVDGLAGVNWLADTSEKTFVTGWAMVGAGGSDFTTDVFAGLGYRISERNAIVGGYRYLSVDREDGDFQYDVEQQGLMLGLSLPF
ncbi:hypothetical protein [Sedimentimonas flavescens]|uniref:hypothetical protein n=1 Tax=Sedimentimonas flavescens TaxID=2851012 RepID=UPI0021A8A845|nr:hypothetical protein [Sedimentimonas flavescens]MCT2541168.1 hypothetical protein [Sedimentimonas flavescens]